jgi:L-rhamnose mutarotase
MGQHAWVLEVRPGYEEEYKKRHDEVWPEMLEALMKAGIHNYSIFRYGLTLFGYFETDDLEKTVAALAKDPVNARWSESMAPAALKPTGWTLSGSFASWPQSLPAIPVLAGP